MGALKASCIMKSLFCGRILKLSMTSICERNIKPWGYHGATNKSYAQYHSFYGAEYPRLANIHAGFCTYAVLGVVNNFVWRCSWMYQWLKRATCFFAQERSHLVDVLANEQTNESHILDWFGFQFGLHHRSSLHIHVLICQIINDSVPMQTCVDVICLVRRLASAHSDTHTHTHTPRQNTQHTPHLVCSANSDLGRKSVPKSSSVNSSFAQ